jgi:twinkle protein
MELINGFEIDEYNIYKLNLEAKSSTCPKCSHTRKKNKDKCMSIFKDTGLGQCNHCGETVQLHTFKKKETTKTYIKPKISPKISSYSNDLLKYIQTQRGVLENTLKRIKVREQKEYMPQTQKEENCICFDYWLNGELINTKFRDGKKNFKFIKGAEKIFYNLDSIRTDKECVIVEGEFDVLAFVEGGVNNVVSVPNGFTAKGSVNLDYLDDYYDYFDNKEKIYIAVDNDEAGINGQKELIRRLGAERCYIVDFKDCKDANEYLLKYSREELKDTLKNAKEIPLEHIEVLRDYEDELDDFFINGCPKGYTTGMDSFDDIYSIEDGQFCVVTGTPQAGKSEFVDAICLGYAMKYNFKTAYCSPENKPNKFHSAKLVKKVYGNTPKNLQDNKYKISKDFVSDYFVHVNYDDGYDLKKVLNKFGELVKRKGIKVFVIDPFNKVKLKGASNNVNDYTNEYLNEIDVFCRKYKALVYLVAHPTKMQKEEGSDTYRMANAYDIKGGGEFFDMSYHIIALRKVREYGLVQLKTLKVKFQHLGEPDRDIYLGWNINNGRYQGIDWIPDEDQHRKIEVWDNDCYLTPTQEENNNVFDNVSIDDFENSVFEGQAMNVTF